MATRPQLQRRDSIMALVKRAPSGLTARQVSEHVGIHYTTANDDLHILQNEGKVLQMETGGPAKVWVPVQ